MALVLKYFEIIGPCNYSNSSGHLVVVLAGKCRDRSRLRWEPLVPAGRAAAGSLWAHTGGPSEQPAVSTPGSPATCRPSTPEIPVRTPGGVEEHQGAVWWWAWLFCCCCLCTSFFVVAARGKVVESDCFKFLPFSLVKLSIHFCNLNCVYIK